MESKTVRYIVEFSYLCEDVWITYSVLRDETKAKTAAKEAASLYGEARITKETTVVTTEVIGKMVKNGGKQ